MLRTQGLMLALSLVLCAAVLSGCNNKSCKKLCEEAQDGNCTSITGDCGDFCDAKDKTVGPAGCEAQDDAYETCLNEGKNVCDVDCDSEENSLSVCVGVYCAQNMSNEDCQTLTNSF